jgi:hypothetical protein
MLLFVDDHTYKVQKTNTTQISNTSTASVAANQLTVHLETEQNVYSFYAWKRNG